MNLDPNSTEEILKGPWIAGALGALVAMGRNIPGATWKERLISIVSGALLAGFLSPAFSEYFGMTTPEMRAAMSFAVGLFGLNLMGSILDWTRTVKVSDFLRWKKGGDI